jgi:tRNA-2-methylthio-N6-dimethylallyladenosine synthase
MDESNVGGVRLKTSLHSEGSNNVESECAVTTAPVRGVYISTYGCQMNVNDSERMLSLLEMQDYVQVPTPEEASLIIINSCSVREKPVHKVHSEVGRYRKLKAINPQLKIGVGGCVGQQEKAKLLADVPLLDFVFGTDSIDKLPTLVAEVEKRRSPVVSAKFEHQAPYHIETLIRNPGITTFVNITKGCDNFCTFCVVPFTRGRERSRPLVQLIDDIQKLVKRGVREVTLLGQNVNSYRSECGANFAHLLRAVAEDTDILRIRYTTSHPKDFNQELVDISQRYRRKICDYVHLPVQSGNTEVLHRMNRGYSREEYIEKARMILQGIPGVALSTDIIVGFPGETEEQFEDTMSLFEEIPYESLYAFKYSPRPFTKAARFVEQIDEKEKSRRLNHLLAVHKDIGFGLAQRYAGKVVPVLVEEFDKEGGTWSGRTSQNKIVHFTCGDVANKAVEGSIVDVRVTRVTPQTLRGEIASDAGK